MKIEETKFPDVFIFTPTIHKDTRGHYIETFKQKFFDDSFDKINFIQDNESQSNYGVLRGLHFQEPPFNQSKLFRVVKGAIIDVIVDIKTDSVTFGEMLITKLDDQIKNQIFIGRGYAHGFVAIEDETIIQYKVDNKYAPKFESGILFNTTKINFTEEIGHEEFIISEKDMLLKPFDDVAFFKTHEYNFNG